MTTFTPPLLLGDRSNEVTLGDVSAVKFGAVTFNDTTATTIAVLPANARVIDVKIDVVVTFDANIDNTLDLNTTGLLAAANISGPPGRAPSGFDSPNAGPFPSEQTVTATYVPVGTPPTTGEALITLLYVVPRPLPA